MNESATCQFREAVPTVEDYCRLRVLAGLSAGHQEAAARALPNTLFGVCAYQGNELVAMGRASSAMAACHLQVCDIAVLPRLQGQGLGKEVMRRLDDWMRASLPPSAYVSLLADGEAHRLYAQFGFAPTAPASIGMYRRFRNECLDSRQRKTPAEAGVLKNLRPHWDSNPGRHRERVMS